MVRKMQEYIAKGKGIFIGLEDSKKSWRICVRSEKMVIHEISMEARYEVLRGYIRKRYPGCGVSVMYEAGFKGFNLYDQLTADGYGCYVLPPHLMEEAKVNKVKTDKRDARKLAKMVEDGGFRSCHVPDRERREDRQICRTLNAVEKEIKSTRNRIRKALVFHGIDTGLNEDKHWGKTEYRALKSLSMSASLSKAMEILLSLLEKLWEYQRSLRNELRSLARKVKYAQTYKVLRSLPGIGWLTAIRLILELGEDFTRFMSGKSLSNFLGLTGSEHSTGERVHKGKITGLGPGFVRSWLIESSWVAIRKDPVLRTKFEQVSRNTGSKKKAIVAVARKLACRLWRCVIHKEEYVVGVVV
jgi:transposase